MREIEETVFRDLEIPYRVIDVASGDLGALLASEAGQLAGLFIVSQVELCDRLENGVAGENLPELQIRVSKANGEKCSRCWNYATSVGADTEHPEICHRCLEALS